MLDGLDDIAWGSLEHNYGDAADVPGLLRDMLDPRRAADAADDLSNHLHHQGGWICSAAVAALPYLVELACTPKALHRTELVELLGDLGTTARHCREHLRADGWDSAWRDALPALARLLDDPDPRLRQMVTYALSTGPADQVVRRLRDRWDREDDVAVQVGLMVCAARVADHLARDWSAEAQDHPRAEVRLAALTSSPRRPAGSSCAGARLCPACCRRS